MDGSQGCIAVAKVYGVAKSTVSNYLERKAKIVETAEGKHTSKERGK